jgi:hypothetical protein
VEYDFDELKALVDEFENNSYPTNRAFFGSEWSPGVDGDLHLYILFANGLGFSIAGYYSSNDEYAPQAHEYSNGHEMFYLMAQNIDLADEFTAGVLAHEFQHMIHWYRDRNEETWMNEGFAEVAAHLNGFDVGGADYEYAFSPDQTLSQWPSEPGTAGGHYGQAFLVLTYFLDRFGAEATQALVAHLANGFDSIDQALVELGAVDAATGETVTADDVFLDWALAMLLQDSSLADGRYGYVSYDNAPEPAYAETVEACPIQDQTRSVSQYGVDYIRLTCQGNYSLIVEGTSLAPILPVEPYSGDFAFWSNRGDSSDMTLTRAFDLGQVSGPVALDYRLWYDIEEGYDYVYLVSDDGGASWSIVETPGGTAEDPSGNSYGWGYNAFSGGGSSGEWIEERIDLSPYAGKEILVRFEYVTDAAVNGEGLLLDDVRIDAIGYEEDFEAGEGDWETEGSCGSTTSCRNPPPGAGRVRRRARVTYPASTLRAGRGAGRDRGRRERGGAGPDRDGPPYLAAGRLPLQPGAGRVTPSGPRKPKRDPRRGPASFPRASSSREAWSWRCALRLPTSCPLGAWRLRLRAGRPWRRRPRGRRRRPLRTAHGSWHEAPRRMSVPARGR